MTKKLHATAVYTAAGRLGDGKPMMSLFVTHTRVVDAIDTPDRYLTGYFLEPSLCTTDGPDPPYWIDPHTTFKYYLNRGHINTMSSEMVLFVNVRMHEEENGDLKLADHATQWEGIKRTWDALYA